MEFDPEYQTVLDVKGSEGIQVAQWVLSNLESRDVNDVHIQIRVDGGINGNSMSVPIQDGGTPPSPHPQTPHAEPDPSPSQPLVDAERDFEAPDVEPKDVSVGSRPHKALALLAEYEGANAAEPWADTQSVYDLRPEVFRNVQDLSAAISTLFNDKGLVVRCQISGHRGYVYRPTNHAHESLVQMESPF